MDTIKQLLNDEIQSEFNELNEIELGSDTYKVAVDGLVKLVDRAIELEKIEVDAEKHIDNKELNKQKLNLDKEKIDLDKQKLDLDKEKIDLDKEKLDLDKEKLDLERIERVKTRELDEEIKRKQLKDVKTDQAFRNGIAIAGIVIQSAITIWGTFKTLKFEETGTVTTIMGKGFVNKLIPKK